MRNLIWSTLNHIEQKMFAPVYRSFGKRLYVKGTQIQGDNGSQDRIVPSLRNSSYEGVSPDIQAADFIAPNATIIANVSIGLNSSVWYGAILVGTKSIKIGDNCVIQDLAHLSREVKIGNNVFVGPNATIQGSELADHSFVSMGATVRHAKVQSGGMVAAGGVITDNVVVKQGQIWAGNPGKFLRHITPIEREVLREHLDQMRDLALIHAEETQKNTREVISGKSEPYQSYMTFEEYMENMYNNDKENVENQFAYSETDSQFVQRRTIMREPIRTGDTGQDYQPYQYNISHLSEKFNLGVHKEEYQKVATKLANKQRFEKDRDPWTKAF